MHSTPHASRCCVAILVVMLGLLPSLGTKIGDRDSAPTRLDRMSREEA